MLNITSSTSRHWTGRKLIDAWGAYGTGEAKIDGTVNPVYFVCSRFDSAGNTVVIGNKLTNPELVCSTGPSSDFSLVVAKYDSDGILLWQKNISGIGLVATFAAYLAIDQSDNIYIVYTYYNEATSASDGDDIALIKLNSEGTIVFTKPIHINYGFTYGGGNMVATTDGLIFSYPWNKINAFSPKEIVISKYDFSGNLVWSFIRDTASAGDNSRTYRIFLSNTSSDFFFVGSTGNISTIATIDRYQQPTVPSTSPTLAYSKTINTTYDVLYSPTFSIDSNDNIYFSVEVPNNNSRVLLKVDSLGDILSARTYNLPLPNYGIEKYLGDDCANFQNKLYFIGIKTASEIGNDFSKNYVCKYNCDSDTFTSLIILTSPTGDSTQAGGGDALSRSEATLNSLTFSGFTRSPVGDQGLIFKLPTSMETITQDYCVPGAPGWSISPETPPTIGSSVISSFSTSINSPTQGTPTITSPPATFSIENSTVAKQPPGNFTVTALVMPELLYPSPVLFKIESDSVINASGAPYSTWSIIDTADCGGSTLIGLDPTPIVNNGQQQFTVSMGTLGYTRYGGPAFANYPTFGNSINIFTSPWGSSTITWDNTTSIIQDLSSINDPIEPAYYNLFYRTKDSPTHYTFKTYPTRCSFGTPSAFQTAVECKGEEYVYTTIDGNKISDVPWTTEWEFTPTTSRNLSYLTSAGFTIPEERIGTAPGAAQIKYVFQNISWCQLGYYANYVFDSILVYPIPVKTFRKTVPGTNLTIRSNVYEGGQYMMAASQGTIFTSPDSDAWTQQTNIAGITDSLRSIAYGNGTYVVVGSAGKIATSTNGTTWTARTSGTTSTLNRVGFGNSVFLAVGRANTILRSTNTGTSWSFVTVSGTYRGIVYNSATSTWVAVGDTGAILTSTNDGVSWTTSTSGTTSQLWTVSIINGVYYAVGQNGTIIKSNDAITWSSNLNDSGNSGYLNYISYGNGVYIVSGDAGIILQSNTGTNGWYQLSSPATVDLNSVLFRNDQFNIAGSPSAGSSVLLGTNDIV